MNEKLKHLQNELEKLERVAVSYSGGVDSTFLLKVAHDQLGEDAIAITVESEFFPTRESDAANEFCAKEGIRQVVIKETLLDNDEIASNPIDRCYICKKQLFCDIKKAAESHGIKHVVDGSNADDKLDYRPGRKALLELGIISPLQDFSKQEIRELSEMLGLETANKPAMACLATRFPTNSPLTKPALDMVEKAEDMLHDLGFSQVRVRYIDGSAKIEVELGEIARLTSSGIKKDVEDALHSFGFEDVYIDPSGYKMGNMNA